MPHASDRLLGRLPSQPDPRTLHLRNYLQPTLPPPPDIRRWDAKISTWGMMGNDRFGNCVIVTAAHAILSWRANELDDTRPISDTAVIELSQEMGALNGFSILERLKYWRRHGMWADRLAAFAAVQPTNPTNVKHAINLFGCADVGLNLPYAWQDTKIWDIGHSRKYDPGSWGGHSVPIIAYDPRFLYVVTWGAIQRMTWPALQTYCDEAYALIDPNWLASDGITPLGFNLQALNADLKALES